jgi:hypothetical protein
MNRITLTYLKDIKQICLYVTQCSPLFEFLNLSTIKINKFNLIGYVKCNLLIY